MKEKFKGFILPKENAREAAIVADLEVFGIENLNEAIKVLAGDPQIQPVKVNAREEFAHNQNNYDVDFSDVREQLYHARLISGKTQEQVAKLIGCDASNLRCIELDQRNPLTHTLRKIQEFINAVFRDFQIG